MLSLNDDGLQLDPAQWNTTWFKGGSEPGVLTLAFLATTRAGHSCQVCGQVLTRTILAAMLAKRAPGYAGLGFSDPRRLALTPSANTDS
jgi:hypothetical protein